MRKLLVHASLRNAFWMIGESSFRLLLGVFVAGIVARYLEPDGYGALNYAIAIYGILTALGKLGLDVIILKELSGLKDKDHIRRIFATSISVRSVGAVIFLGIYIATVFATLPVDQTVFLIAVINLGLLFQPLDVVEIFFQAQSRSREVVQLKLIQLVVGAAFRFWLVYIKADLIWFAGAVFMDQVLLSFIYLFLMTREKISFSLRLDRVLANKLLRESLPLLASSLFVLIYMRIDQVMIKHFLGDASVGLYSAASKLTEVWFFVPVAVMNSFTPIIMKTLTPVSDKEFNRRTAMLIQGLFVLSVLFALFVQVIAGLAVTIIFGEAYADAANILRVYVWSGVFVAMGYAQTPWLIGKKQQLTFLSRAILGAVVNICLNYPFIQMWGILGACFSTLIAHFVASFLFDLFSAKTRPLFWIKLRAVFLLPPKREEEAAGVGGTS